MSLTHLAREVDVQPSHSVQIFGFLLFIIKSIVQPSPTPFLAHTKNDESY
jgi:hypothetical protein